MRIEPLGDKIVVRPVEPEEATAGGIFLPQQARDRPREGRVLSVGEGRRRSNGTRIPLQVSEGDRVVYSEYGGTEVQVDGHDLLVMTEDNIIAILE